MPVLQVPLWFSYSQNVYYDLLSSQCTVACPMSTVYFPLCTVTCLLSPVYCPCSLGLASSPEMQKDNFLQEQGLSQNNFTQKSA